ncbi:MAG TPA: alpha/beta hydrolase [Candidatus Saccharimonadales bacterium]
MQVIIDGLLINYQKEGSGKTLLLLHGWNDNSIGLADLRKSLAKDYCVITPDLPGFGASDAPKKDWGLEDYAQFIKKFVAKVGSGTLYAGIGHSNGAAILIKSVSEGLITPEKLILLGAAGIRQTQKGKMTTIKLTTKAGKIILSPLPRKYKQKIRRRLYSQIGSDLLVAEHLTGTFKKIVSEDLQSQAKKIDIPTLLMYGEEDNQTPVVYGELYHQLINGSTLEVITDAGHFVHLDKPKVVVNLIIGYLKQ